MWSPLNRKVEKKEDSLPDLPPLIQLGVTLPEAPPNPRVFVLALGAVDNVAGSVTADGSKRMGAGNSATAPIISFSSGGGLEEPGCSVYYISVSGAVEHEGEAG